MFLDIWGSLQPGGRGGEGGGWTVEATTAASQPIKILTCRGGVSKEALAAMCGVHAFDGQIVRNARPGQDGDRRAAMYVCLARAVCASRCREAQNGSVAGYVIEFEERSPAPT